MIKRMKELISLHIGEDEYKLNQINSKFSGTHYSIYKNDSLYAVFEDIFEPARYLVELWYEHEGGKE